MIDTVRYGVTPPKRAAIFIPRMEFRPKHPILRVLRGVLFAPLRAHFTSLTPLRSASIVGFFQAFDGRLHRHVPLVPFA